MHVDFGVEGQRMKGLSTQTHPHTAASNSCHAIAEQKKKRSKNTEKEWEKLNMHSLLLLAFQQLKLRVAFGITVGGKAGYSVYHHKGLVSMGPYWVFFTKISDFVSAWITHHSKTLWCQCLPARPCRLSGSIVIGGWRSICTNIYLDNYVCLTLSGIPWQMFVCFSIVVLLFGHALFVGFCRLTSLPQ